jgi:type VI secretion system protein ImpG
MDPNLYQNFLVELRSLEEFRRKHLAMYPWTPLESDDPDVRHLVEAMAYFSARSRLAARKSMTSMQRRLVYQFFPSLLTPMPAAGMFEAQPSSKLMEKVTLPRGTETQLSAKAGDSVVFRTENGGASVFQPEGDRSAIFRTLEDMVIEPLAIRSLRLTQVSSGRQMICLGFEAWAGAAVETLHLFVDMRDPMMSAKVMEELREHLLAVRVASTVADLARGDACTFALGERQVPGSDPELDGLHPLEKLRRALHMPEIQHYLNIGLPAMRVAGTFWVGLEMDADWEPDPYLGERNFRPAVVPIQNLNRSNAAPIEHDGTRDRHRLRPLDPGPEVRSVRTVRRIDESGSTLLSSGIIPGDAGRFEFEEGGVILVQVPGAVENPATLVVDADWYDPDFSQYADARLKVAPYRRQVGDVKFSLVGPFKAHKGNSPPDQLLYFLQLLALRLKPKLSAADLRLLVRSLGVIEDSGFAPVLDRLQDARVRDVPHVELGALSIDQHYTLRFRDLPEELSFLAARLGRHIHELLDTWLVRTRVHVTTEVGSKEAS